MQFTLQQVLPRNKAQIERKSTAQPPKKSLRPFFFFLGTLICHTVCLSACLPAWLPGWLAGWLPLPLSLSLLRPWRLVDRPP